MTGYYIPSIKGGGPIRSIKNLVDRLSNKADFYIITYNRDLGDNEQFSNIETDEWVQVGNANVLYINTSKLTWLKMEKIINSLNFDMIYLNSFFSYKYSFMPVMLRRMKRIPKTPIVIAPRGEFSPGALKLKNEKKKIYIFFTKILGVYNDILWHGTTETEKYHIKQIFNTSKIIIANNLTEDYSMLNYKKKIEKKKGKLKIVFVSRIHPKKNLTKSIELLNKINGEIEFNIYGPIEDEGYWMRCKKMIQELPQNIKVVYRGILSHAQVREVFMEHHVFLFPTLGENYGHVISEALIGGCPVIVSDRTPWNNLEKKQVGWDIPLKNDDKFIEVLNYCLQLNQDEYEKIAKRAFSFGKERSLNPNDKIDTERLFNI